MKLIPVRHRGRIVAEAMVDDLDHDLVSRHRWYLDESGNGSRRTLYATALFGRPWGPASVSLHRLIMGLTANDGLFVDHLDHNGLNCQRSNLRVCDWSTNMHNRRLFSVNKTGHRGVSYNHRSRTYVANLSVRGVKMPATRHATLEEAVASRRAMAALHGLPE